MKIYFTKADYVPKCCFHPTFKKLNIKTFTKSLISLNCSFSIYVFSLKCIFFLKQATKCNFFYTNFAITSTLLSYSLNNFTHIT